MQSTNERNDRQEAVHVTLPAEYAVPEVHELGGCEELTRGSDSGAFWEIFDSGLWC